MPKDIRSFFKKSTEVVKKASKTTGQNSASPEINSEENERPTVKKAKSKPNTRKKAPVIKVPPKKGAAVRKKKSKTKSIPKEIKRKPKRNYELSSEDEWREESEEESDNDGIGRKRKGNINSSKRPIVIDSDDEEEVALPKKCVTKTIPEIMQSLPKRKTEPKIVSPKPEMEFVDPDDFFSQPAPVKKKKMASSLLIEELLQRDASLEADKTELVQESQEQHNKPLIEKEKVETVVAEKSKPDKPQQEKIVEEKPLEKKEKLVVSKDQVVEGAQELVEKKEPIKEEDKKLVAKEQNNESNVTTTDLPLFKRPKVVVPEGAPNCLKNLRFVITSVLDSLSFEAARDLIIKYGGEVTKSGSISSRTTHVLTGKLSSSRKLAKARELNVAVIHEDDLFDLIRTRTPPAEVASKKKCVSVPRVLGSGESEMWVDKYRPKTSRDLIGNASAVKQLRDFLKHWPPTSAGKRAALLSGPPGIGKSSAAAIVALECGFEVVEMNASDTRSKKLLAAKVERMTASRSISEFFIVDHKAKRERELLSSKAAMSQSLGKRSVIVMDEVDGMSSGDRGGVQELIKLIKTTKVPVVCICNDRASPKMRSLANYCIDLRFRRGYRPTAQQVMARLGGIARTEGLAIESPVMAKLSEATRGDIRQMLHTLQLWKASSSSVSFDEAKERLSSSEKNFTMNVFDVVPGLFRRLRDNEFDWMDTRIDSYFVDPGLVPLMVQGAYLNAKPVLSAESCKRLSSAQQELAMLSRYAGAALAISDGDLVDARIRSTMSFALMPTHAVLSSLAPGVILSGDLHARVDFPVWMGKNSTRRKNVRLASDLRTHMSRRVTGDTKSMLLDYLPVLRQRLTRPLVMHENSGIEEVVNLMKMYGLSRDDFDSIVELGGAFGAKLSLSAKLKAAFTRHYNSRSGCVPVALGKKKRKRSEADDKQLVNEDDVAEHSDVDQGESADENFDEENEENDRMIQRKSASKDKRPPKKKSKVGSASKGRRSK